MTELVIRSKAEKNFLNFKLICVTTTSCIVKFQAINPFENASIDASEWRYETEQRLEVIEFSLGQTTTQPDVEPTQPPTDCP